MWNFFFGNFENIFQDSYNIVSIKADDKGWQLQNLIFTFGSDPKIICYERELDMLFMMSQNKPEYSIKYKQTKKDSNKPITKMKQYYFVGKMLRSDNKTKTTFDLIKSLNDENNSQQPIFPSGNPHEILNDFNSFFVNVTSENISGSAYD